MARRVRSVCSVLNRLIVAFRRTAPGRSPAGMLQALRALLARTRNEYREAAIEASGATLRRPPHRTASSTCSAARTAGAASAMRVRDAEDGARALEVWNDDGGRPEHRDACDDDSGGAEPASV